MYEMHINPIAGFRSIVRANKSLIAKNMSVFRCLLDSYCQYFKRNNNNKLHECSILRGLFFNVFLR